jgi:hypothetical protein
MDAVLVPQFEVGVTGSDGENGAFFRCESGKILEVMRAFVVAALEDVLVGPLFPKVEAAAAVRTPKTARIPLPHSPDLAQAGAHLATHLRDVFSVVQIKILLWRMAMFALRAIRQVGSGSASHGRKRLSVLRTVLPDQDTPIRRWDHAFGFGRLSQRRIRINPELPVMRRPDLLGFQLESLSYSRKDFMQDHDRRTKIVERQLAAEPLDQPVYAMASFHEGLHLFSCGRLEPDRGPSPITHENTSSRHEKGEETCFFSDNHWKSVA